MILFLWAIHLIGRSADRAAEKCEHSVFVWQNPYRININIINEMIWKWLRNPPRLFCTNLISFPKHLPANQKKKKRFPRCYTIWRHRLLNSLVFIILSRLILTFTPSSTTETQCKNQRCGAHSDTRVLKWIWRWSLFEVISAINSFEMTPSSRLWMLSICRKYAKE